MSRADDLLTVPLHAAAHARAGDKGNRINIGLFPYDPEAWPLLARQVSEGRVLDLFRHRGATAVRRYDLPLIHGFNFVIDDVLEGGVNGALNLDGHGKSHSFRLLSLEVRLPRGLIAAQSPWRARLDGSIRGPAGHRQDGALAPAVPE